MTTYADKTTQIKPRKAAPITLDTFWPYQAVRLANLVSRHVATILKSRGGLNLSQWRVLAAIAEAPGRSAAAVVAVTPMDKGIVSRAVASLVDAGLVRRESAATDKRRSALYLTQNGQTVYEDISQALLTSLGDLAYNKDLLDALAHAVEGLQAVRAKAEGQA